MRTKWPTWVFVVLTVMLSMTEILNLIIVGEPNNLPVTISLIVFLWVVHFIDNFLFKLGEKKSIKENNL